ncbi:hypothetical protein L1049_018547 [Liquidambar formosana]|uniref:Peptide transporter n=1 Tax=Liquidambar formosana TaxID=63359 RepID=A0AAP0RB13_LIQFO
MESTPPDQKKMITEPLLGTTKGGFRTLPFIIANEAFEKVASYGLVLNMIVYLRREYGMETTAGTNVLFLWSAATNFMPIIGAFIADSYVGRYRMIGFGSIISLLMEWIADSCSVPSKGQTGSISWSRPNFNS